MALSFCNSHFTYFRICSSSSPTVLTQYPFAQKCLPQYRLFNSKCISNIFMALFPFKKPTNSETEYFGGIDNTKWIWSICTLPSRISACFHSHSCLTISPMDLPIPPFKSLNRYFGHHTIWYLHSQSACAHLLKSFIKYLLLTFRATVLYPKEVFAFMKSLTYPHSKARTIKLS